VIFSIIFTIERESELYPTVLNRTIFLSGVAGDNVTQQLVHVIRTER